MQEAFLPLNLSVSCSVLVVLLSPPPPSSSSCSPLLAHDHGEEQARHDDVTAHPPPL